MEVSGSRPKGAGERVVVRRVLHRFAIFSVVYLPTCSGALGQEGSVGTLARFRGGALGVSEASISSQPQS